MDSIQEAFSVEPITKQFYEKLQRWYFWAIKNVKFPKDAEQEPNGREIAIIRLITRLMFIWFMKVRNLISNNLFNEGNISKILKDFSAEESTYYKAILQNLFFATLNTKQNERKFRSEKRWGKGYNPDYGNQNVFRYHNLFRDNESLINLSSKIPFLNGGLFECLDYKAKDKNERKYINGFTATKENQPKIPNFLFFSKIQKVDISSFFGNANKTYEVEGLINLLNSYNFTIDENEPDDIEVALDPELLGSIFENLLASYNPETATTARKATGSFYTPREIVNYMTTESLKQYLKQSIGSILLPNNNNKPKQDVSDTYSDTYLNPNDEIIIKQGKLPHWQQDNSWYFVTFRLADSLPKEKVEQLKKDREKWFGKHKKKDREEYSKEELKEYYYLFSERVEKWMNAGYGKCVLKDKLNAEIVANALKHFEGKRYELDEWVVMPNHVHVLVKPFESYSLSDITHSWKSFTANEINKNINASGQLWMHESYDHIVRNEKAFAAIKNYIRQNPIKAGIVPKIVPKASSFQEQKQKEVPKQDALDTLDTLFDSNSENPFDKQTTKKIIDLINNLRVVDPAVGSGAFPMAMLNKLVFILSKLDPENKQWKQSQIDGVKKSVSDSVIQRKLIEQIERQFKDKNADYGRKLYLIEKCIYGVDIQQIAVEIAKLRFFISLLVDEKIDFDKPENNYGIEPLPNLDFKLMQGNSLISTYAGIDFNDKEKPSENLLLDIDEPYKKLIKEFEELKHQYQNEPDNITKKTLRDKIDKAIIKIFEEKLSEHFPELKRIEENAKLFPKEEQRKKYITGEKQKLTKKLGFDIEQIEKDLTAYTEGRKAKKFFLWNVYFAEVFNEKQGFDIVIGNPPYIKERDNAHIFAPVNSSDFGKIWHQGKMDFWYYFLHKAIDIKSKYGIIAFITPRYWIQSSGATKLINRIKDNIYFSSILDIGKIKVFNSVVGQHMVAIYVSERCIKTVYKQIKNTIDDIFISINTENISISYIDTNRIINNNEIRFTFSEVDFIKNNEILNLGDILDCSQGVVEAPDKISRKAYLPKIVKDVSIGDGVFILNQTEITEKGLNDTLLKPYLDPNAVGRYFINHSGEYLIYSDKSIKEEIRSGKFKKIKEHLDKYKPYITSSNKPYGIHRPREKKYFENPKLICKGMFSYPDFTYDAENYYVGFSFTVMIQKDSNFLLKYVLAILNSKLAHYWFFYNGKRRGVGFDIGVKKFRQFPIIKTDLLFQKKLEIIVDQILVSKKENLQADTTAEERKIDIMVYKLYDLTYDEVKIVDPEFPSAKEEYENYE